MGANQVEIQRYSVFGLTEIIVDLGINEGLGAGTVRKPCLPRKGSVYLFLGFTVEPDLLNFLT